MKLSRFFILLPAFAALALAVPVTAQLSDSLRSSQKRRADAAQAATAQAATEEARVRLARAEASATAERARLNRESAEPNPLAERAATARPPEMSLKEKARSLADETQFANVLSNLSKEGRQALQKPVPVAVVVEEEEAPQPIAPVIVVAQNTEPPPQAQPGTATPPPASAPSPGSPQPQRLKPTPIENPSLKSTRTVITCSGSSFFDANKAIGIFTGDVRVYHPQFYLECDDLEVFMKKDSPSKGPKAAIESDTPTEESSIDKVIARGAMVIIEKFTENRADIQVGKCKQLTYDGSSGMVTLRIWPQIQRGAHLQIADEASTVMTISPEGHFKSSNGRTRTEILQGADATPKTKGLRRAPEQ